MCGRFTLSKPVRAVAELFKLAEPPAELAPRYNIAPSQPVAAVAPKRDGVTRGLAFLKWGLVPSWADGATGGYKPTNARSDSLHKPMFREAFRVKRCLIPADGFYEWKAEGKKKLPVHFRLTDDAVFGMAGLWEVWTDGTTKLATCCLITTEANAVVGAYHDRMPVIVPPEAHAAWLAFDTPERELRALLRPYPAERMLAQPANPIVNKAAVEGPECLSPAA